VSAEPIAVTPLWRTVIAAAAGRCTCTGACGRSHAASKKARAAGIASDGRCRVEAPAARLFAAPVDMSVPAEQAYRVPVEALTAWCGPCLDVARRQHRPAPVAVETGALFALDSDEPAKVTDQNGGA